MRVLIIIPAFNEEESIVDVVDKVVAAGYDYVVVNDGSTDRTPELCREHGFNFLDLSQNLGIGGAVQAGHCYAKTFGYDVDIQFDGDGQHDINYVPALLKGIEDGADLVVGSRFISDENQFMSSSLRRLGIRWLRWVLKVRCGITVTDATSGFRASGKRAIDQFCKYYPVDYPEPESIASAASAGLKIAEAPVVMHERQGGVSSIGGLSSVYYMIKVTLAIILASRQNRR